MKIINAILIMLVLILSLILLAGCQKTTPTPTPVSETACKTDSDCACGTHKETGICFVGNKAFVNVEKQCPDFCTGIAVMFETKCVNNECKQVKKGTVVTPNPEKACTTDDDCKCGTHKDTGECFIGNKAFVNTKEICPDFCTGYTGMETIKCVNKECKSVEKETVTPTTECAVDADCVPEQCCHATTCIPKEKKGVCNLVCTMECRGGTLDCGGYCSCENGKCTAQLNDL